MTKITTPYLPNLLFTLFFLLIILAKSQSQLYDQEHGVLMKLHQHWNNPPGISHWDQSNSASHCTWPEIICVNNSVTELSLNNISITNSIPPFICDLNNLTLLDLQLNYIPGPFPTVLYNCTNLEHIDLSQNYFIGPIPGDINRLSRLKYLSLAANNFSEDIPVNISLLTELRKLHLFQNQFNGTFPPEIGNLLNLELLNLAYNSKLLPWNFPGSFTRLQNLKTLWMVKVNLIGEIPETIGNMTSLEVLDMSENSLTGKIPSGLFTLKNLKGLYLSKNKLSGEIPQVVESVNLTTIVLTKNNLTGSIPEEFGKLEKLSNFSVAFNQLSGGIPESIARIPTLIDIRLFYNKFSGALPPDFGRYSPLEAFEVSLNNFTGSLPQYLCSKGRLLGLVAFDNHLTGELPESLGNCSSLEIVSIYNNEFSGNIPEGLWRASNLVSLLIYDNKFTGELPDIMSQNLSRLEIYNNRFSGNIPVGVRSWRNLRVFKASNNIFTGAIPRELTALTSLMTLSLDQNRLSGPLSCDIISWTSLTSLNLSRNQLSGEIEEKIGYLPDLIDLDLSENRFSGQIPPQLGHLTLTSFNLSSNHLTGEIPSVFENAAYSSSFLNNPGLCSESQFLELNSCSSIRPRRLSKLSSQNLALILIAVTVVFLLSLLASLLFIIKVHRKRKDGLYSGSEITSFQRLNFTESDILPKLSDNNVIGSGGYGKVYRVNINRSEEVVAVKKMWNTKKMDKKHEKEFLAEVEVLSTIRHVNIVTLLCCISSENLKLLVYEYLENGSLDQWLHKKKDRTSNRMVLDWPKRMKIAIGAAQGLCYLHHDCSPPVIHRDVKSSNVLLDSEFNAKIADFGLAKMLMKRGDLETMSSFAGSFGYIAPECAHTMKLNEKIDIYSFGVILLELTTGREANSGDEHTYLTKWAWQYFQRGNPVVDALDEDIKEPCYFDEMSRVFRLGLICTSTPPSARPSMKMVLQVLLNIPFDSSQKDAVSHCKYDSKPLLESSKLERVTRSDDADLVSLKIQSRKE